MDLKETDILGDRIGAHWYYHAKARAMERMLGDAGARTILDVGAGSGFFSRYLLDRSAREAWCVDISYDADADETVAGKPLHRRRSIDAVDADTVLLMDVLEHVDDDVGLLKAYVDKVPGGSRFLITVPAFEFLWSDHDVFLEHKRRYTLDGIEGVARRAGLDVERGAYYFGAIFPLAAAIRLSARGSRSTTPRSQLKLHSPLVNATLKAACAMELPFVRANRVAGLSAFCVGRKA